MKALRHKATRAVELARGQGLGGQLIRGGIGSLALKITNTVPSLTVSILLARILGPEGYGVYAVTARRVPSGP